MFAVPSFFGYNFAKDAFVGLLDLYPNAAAAYSVRKLRTAYTGSAIRVRRSSDNAEQNIGFTSAFGLDTTSLSSFCSGTNGFVTTWYDQSGNGLNVTQTTAANQPQIVSAGSVVTVNTKAAFSFDGINDFLNGGDILKAGSNPMTTFSVVKFNNTSNQSIYAKSLLGSAAGRYALLQEGQMFSLTSVGNAGSGTMYTGQNLFNVEIIPSSTNKIYRNNIQIASASVSASIGDSIFDFEIGGYNNTSGGASNNLPLNGNTQEIIIYFSNQSSNLSAINTNINTYYAIY
jgi:hypothetical protein